MSISTIFRRGHSRSHVRPKLKLRSTLSAAAAEIKTSLNFDCSRSRSCNDVLIAAALAAAAAAAAYERLFQLNLWLSQQQQKEWSFNFNCAARLRPERKIIEIDSPRFLCNQVIIKLWLDTVKFALWSLLNNKSNIKKFFGWRILGKGKVEKCEIFGKCWRIDGGCVN